MSLYSKEIDLYRRVIHTSGYFVNDNTEVKRIQIFIPRILAEPLHEAGFIREIFMIIFKLFPLTVFLIGYPNLKWFIEFRL